MSSTLTGTNRAAVHFYNQHGTAEQWIKEAKEANRWTRLSCHGSRTNEVRLFLGVIAYNLGNLLRRLVLPLAIQSWSLTRLQQRLFKTGGRLIRHARYYILRLAESHLRPRLFEQVLGRVERLVWDVTSAADQPEREESMVHIGNANLGRLADGSPSSSSAQVDLSRSLWQDRRTMPDASSAATASSASARPAAPPLHGPSSARTPAWS